MDVYLVGGAVRDALLNRPAREKDWVVVGSTPEEMLRLGYRQVGRDFPVFLHPDSGEEYALARTERKTGPGHTGFVCHAGADVTLEDDLRRRDLTVNAMARAGDDTLIDPFGGRDDLAAGCLRHVSEAFVEDPLRVFRVARFAAQLPGFRVAPQTLALMRRMAERGELAELAAERVWRELDKALDTDAPDAFFTVLADAGAMAPWFVELAPAPRLPAALKRPEQRFGALAWGRPLTLVRQLCKRLKAPKRFAGLAERVAAHGALLADWRTGSPQTVHDALAGIGALDPQRDPGPVLEVIEACAGTDLAALAALGRRLAAVVAAPYVARGLTGPEVGEAMRRERLELVETELAGA